MGDICEQRRRQMLFNMPPVRITPKSPYVDTNYTQRDLDMRRKAEILQYGAGKSSTKTNNLTKKEKWSQIANGKYIGNVLYKSPTTECPNDLAIPTPTSSSGVPGPIMSLYLDSTVPLYNYATKTDAYAINPPEKVVGWTMYNIPDVICKSSYVDVESVFATLYIRSKLDTVINTYTLTTPIAIYVSGTNKNESLTEQRTISVKIENIIPTIYYNGDMIRYLKGGPVISLDGKDINTNDDDGNKINPVIMDLSLNKSTTTEYGFGAVAYAGILTISNIVLNVEEGYIYDFNLIVNLSINPKSTIKDSDFNNLTTNCGIYCNLNESNYIDINNKSKNINCTVNSVLSTRPYSPFSVVELGV